MYSRLLRNLDLGVLGEEPDGVAKPTRLHDQTRRANHICGPATPPTPHAAIRAAPGAKPIIPFAADRARSGPFVAASARSSPPHRDPSKLQDLGYVASLPYDAGKAQPRIVRLVMAGRGSVGEPAYAITTGEFLREGPETLAGVVNLELVGLVAANNRREEVSAGCELVQAGPFGISLSVIENRAGRPWGLFRRGLFAYPIHAFTHI